MTLRITISAILVALLATLLSACGTTPVRDPSSPYFLPPDGSRLMVHKPIAIAAHRGWTYIQGGDLIAQSGVLSFQGVDQYYPHCMMELHSRNADRFIIEPDEFIIHKTAHYEELVQARPVTVAGRGLSVSDAGLTAINMQTIYYLHSERQPEVWRMVCQHWDDPHTAQFLTLAQIRSVLGELVSIELD